MNDAERGQVEGLAAYGIAVADIALILRTTERELHDAFADELETGAARANSRVAENLYRRATGESREAVTAAIFWLKARAGWRDSAVRSTDDAPAVRYVVRCPEPVATTEEWLERYAHIAIEDGR